jgi:hypothetical protein
MFTELGYADLFLVTANSFIKQNGSLVMGAGAAGKLTKLYPHIPFEAGQLVREVCGHLGVYGVLVLTELKGKHVGIFQTKKNYMQPSSVALIAYSCELLCKLAAHYNRVVVNFPGIGYGLLEKDLVQVYTDTLPNNVYIYESLNGVKMVNALNKRKVS